MVAQKVQSHQFQGLSSYLQQNSDFTKNVGNVLQQQINVLL